MKRTSCLVEGLARQRRKVGLTLAIQGGGAEGADEILAVFDLGGSQTAALAGQDGGRRGKIPQLEMGADIKAAALLGDCA